jgi:hypothetical protein
MPSCRPRSHSQPDIMAPRVPARSRPPPPSEQPRRPFVGTLSQMQIQARRSSESGQSPFSQRSSSLASTGPPVRRSSSGSVIGDEPERVTLTSVTQAPARLGLAFDDDLDDLAVQRKRPKQRAHERAAAAPVERRSSTSESKLSQHSSSHLSDANDSPARKPRSGAMLRRFIPWRRDRSVQQVDIEPAPTAEPGAGPVSGSESNSEASEGHNRRRSFTALGATAADKIGRMSISSMQMFKVRAALLLDTLFQRKPSQSVFFSLLTGHCSIDPPPVPLADAGNRVHDRRPHAKCRR